MSSEYNSSLLACVEDAARDILNDYMNEGRKHRVPIRDIVVECDEGADDDGGTWGRFRITSNGGQFFVELEADAQLVYDGDYEWDSTEQRSVFEGSYRCEDFNFKVLKACEMSGAIDRMVEVDQRGDK